MPNDRIAGIKDNLSMKESSTAYVPKDRLIALAEGRSLPAEGQGSVLFADISGFTPLTEAYEQHLGSRRGGEELARILNEVYDQMIDEVDKVRGSVIGFAGDAITCWMDGDDGSRAVSSALAMQSGMERFSAVPSPGGGTIALGLKAAVTTGRVRRFEVGQPGIQRVDVLAGEPVYRVAEVEQLANRGDVLIDAATRKRLGNAITIAAEKQLGDGRPFAWKVTSIQSVQPCDPWPAVNLIDVSQEVIDPWMVAAIRDRLNSGMGEFLTELRPATAMFVRFGGIDFEKDPDAGNKLDAFFSWVQGVVNSYEGVVHQLTLGDKGSFLYAAFGAPISHEDDTARAMSTALELRALPPELLFIDSIQIGLARGSTRSGAYGGSTRRTYGVLGDQVNLSARLMGKAAPGQILVSGTAAVDCLESYQLEKLDPIMVKGKSAPVEVYSLGGRRDRYASGNKSRGYATPMVGRESQFTFIKEQLDSARNGQGQLIQIEADAGMGKTRLLNEVILHAKESGYRVLRGECQAFGSKTIYTPWWTVWRDFFGLAGETSPEQAVETISAFLEAIDDSLRFRIPVLGPALDIAIPDNSLTGTFDPKLRRASLEALLVDCLNHVSAGQPQLIVIEDAHAIDSVSRDLLQMLIQAIARQRVAILFTNRPVNALQILRESDRQLEYAHKLVLPEFNNAETHQLIRTKIAQLFGSPELATDLLINKIAEKTGGNPFFIEEVINWIHNGKIDIRSMAALERADLPTSLYSLVLSRMDQLDESSRVTMKVASVIGRIFRPAIIWGIYPELGGESRVMDSLNTLELNDFTVPEAGDEELAYLFKHVVIHEVSYESLPNQLREHLHEAIAIFIEERFPERTGQVLDLLAFHFGRSTNLDKKRKYLVLAGDQARQAYYNASAITYYKASIPLLQGEEKYPVLRNLGKVLEFSGEWEESLDYYRQALSLAGKLDKPLYQADCQVRIGDMLWKQGVWEEAEDWLTKAMEAFDQLDHQPGVGLALKRLGTLSAQSGNYKRATELFSASLEIRRKTGDKAEVASLLSNLGILSRFQGDIPRALELQEESLSIRRELDDHWAIGNSLNNLGMAKRYNGDLEGARKVLREAVDIYKKVGDRAAIANTLNSLAEVTLDQQDINAAEAILQESLAITRQIGYLLPIAFILEAFATSAFIKRNPERCLIMAGAAKSLRESIGAPLPDSDQAKMDEIIDLSLQAYHAGNAREVLEKGSQMPLSAALDYAST